MSIFTKDSTYGEVFSTPEFKEYIPFITPFFKPDNEQACKMKLSAMREGGGIAEAKGLNRLYDLIKEGRQVLYNVYSDEEIKKEPSKARTVLFHLPAKEQKSKKFALVCAGGGYNIVCTPSESLPVAEKLNEMGYTAFVLNYRCGKGITQPTPNNDLANALRFIIKNKEKFGVCEEGYSVTGFSAGAHLVSAIGTDNLGYKYHNLPKPGLVCLAYPVITMGEMTHMGSREFLFGIENKNNEELIDKYSTEKHVTADYPPCFVWQCDKDSLVPIENSKLMAKALEKAGVPYIYETYDSDVHGWGIAYLEDAEGWVERAVELWEKESV